MDFDVIRATVLALIQGLTEFLPISSSAHLILPSQLWGWEDQGLPFDMALHLGSLVAVLVYFRRDLWNVARAMLVQVSGGQGSDDSKLGWHIIIATIPVLIAGLLFEEVAETSLRSVYVITATTLVFGVLLGVADRVGLQNRTLAQVTWKISLIIGLAQMLAIIPGTSRSGVTMTAALFCRMERSAAARFSFLLSIPTIGAAASMALLELMGTPNLNWGELLYAMAMSALTAFVCIHWFLKIIGSLGFLPFVVYRLLLGTFLLFFFVL
jgi:undecaprenyl-diphosphatase